MYFILMKTRLNARENPTIGQPLQIHNCVDLAKQDHGDNDLIKELGVDRGLRTMGWTSDQCGVSTKHTVLHSAVGKNADGSCSLKDSSPNCRD